MNRKDEFMETDLYKELSKAYFHINNGGINIKVLNNIYVWEDYEKNIVHNEILNLNINCNHFGIQTNNIKIPMTSNDMKELGKMLIKTANDFKTEKLDSCYLPTIEEGIDISYNEDE
jgi:hypothetical protein